MENNYPKILSCPNCNHENESWFDSEYIVCANCGANLETTSGKEVGESKSVHEKYKPWSFLEKGQTFLYENTKYRIVGRVQITGTCTVYGVDENGDDTSNNHSISYQEWFCRGIKHIDKELIITEDKYGFKVSEPIIPENKENPAGKSKLQFKADAYYREITEKGMCRVVYLEGETNEELLVGQRFAYKMYEEGMYIYGVEWVDGDDFENHRYYKQVAKPKHLLSGMIELDNDISYYKKRELEYDILRVVVVLTAFVSLFFLIASLSQDGNRFFRAKAELQDITEEGLLATEVLTIEDPNKTYKIEYGVNMVAGNSDVYVATEVINENTNVINLFDHEFYKATGVADGERWVENDINETTYLTFNEPGKYRFVFYMEKLPKTKVMAGDTIYISVSDGIILSRYWGIVLALFSVLSILMFDYHISIRIKNLYFKIFKL